MSCNSCAKAYTLFRKEKGCPNCGFSFCSKCLDNTIFVQKLGLEAKVCRKCNNSVKNSTGSKKIEPPDAYYKRLGLMKNETTTNNASSSGTQDKKDEEILKRLQKLKEDSKQATAGSSEQEIADRLQKIKGDAPKTTDGVLQERLAKLRGVPVRAIQSPSVLPPPETRSDQEQADDLLKQYMDQTKMDSRYKDEFDALVGDIETRLNNLKGAEGCKQDQTNPEVESEDEEETVRKIVEKVKAEASMDSEEPTSTNDELPFCEICNEDAKMRCLGCRYLFCKRCYMEHRDDDYGCDQYDPYTPPKNSSSN